MTRLPTWVTAAVVTAAVIAALGGVGVSLRVNAADGGSPAESATDGLTDRESDVLALLAEGASNAQIARALGLSVKTVQNYVSRILDKLQVADRTQAALLGRRRR